MQGKVLPHGDELGRVLKNTEFPIQKQPGGKELDEASALQILPDNNSEKCWHRDADLTISSPHTPAVTICGAGVPPAIVTTARVTMSIIRIL